MEVGGLKTKGSPPGKLPRVGSEGQKGLQGEEQREEVCAQDPQPPLQPTAIPPIMDSSRIAVRP